MSAQPAEITGNPRLNDAYSAVIAAYEALEASCSPLDASAVARAAAELDSSLSTFKDRLQQEFPQLPSNDPKASPANEIWSRRLAGLQQRNVRIAATLALWRQFTDAGLAALGLESSALYDATGSRRQSVPHRPRALG